MRRETLRRARRLLTDLDQQEFQRVRQGLQWQFERAEYVREHINRSTTSGQSWLRTYGVCRSFVRNFARMAREHEAAGDHGPVRLFRRMVGLSFTLRKPVSTGDK